MKYALITGVVIACGVGVWFLNNEEVTYIKETEVVTETVEVDALEQAIKDAQEVKRHQIEEIAKKAYDEAYSQEMKKTELEVIKSFNEKLEARQIELEKETKVY